MNSADRVVAAWTRPRVRLMDASRWAMVAAAASVPFSTAATNVAMGVALLLLLLSGAGGAVLRRMARNPVARACAAMWLLVVAGTAWSSAPAGEALMAVDKYRELLVLAWGTVAFRPARWRVRVLAAFLASATLLLLVSTGLGLQAVARLGSLDANVNATVLRHHITHSYVIAVAAAVGWLWMRRVRGRPARVAAIVLALVAVADLLLLIQGRTGQVVLAAIIVMLALRRRGLRGAVLSLACVLLVAGTAYQLSPSFAARVDRAGADIAGFSEHDYLTSLGSRLNFVRESVGIWRAHPVLGTGTGSWTHEFRARLTPRARAGGENNRAGHPHNEYVHILVQLGVVGLGAFLLLIGLWTRSAMRLPEPWAGVALVVITAFVVACLANSLLWDSVEAHLTALLLAAAFSSATRERRGVAAWIGPTGGVPPGSVPARTMNPHEETKDDASHHRTLPGSDAGEPARRHP